MNILNKIGLILIFATLPVAASFADTPVHLQGLAPQSVACSPLQGIPFGITMKMPASPEGMPIIDHTSDFKFVNPQGVVFNKEGVENSCDYYAAYNDIIVNMAGKPQRLTLERLIINSKYVSNDNFSGCVEVKVYLRINAIPGGTRTSCDIDLTH